MAEVLRDRAEQIQARLALHLAAKKAAEEERLCAEAEARLREQEEAASRAAQMDAKLALARDLQVCTQ